MSILQAVIAHGACEREPPPFPSANSWWHREEKHRLQREDSYQRARTNAGLRPASLPVREQVTGARGQQLPRHEGIIRTCGRTIISSFLGPEKCLGPRDAVIRLQQWRRNDQDPMAGGRGQ
ncbi:hypothetical protein NDU88_000771 [Pleurodeles waltl]|uniref:Uncharacterized protein n=1 Tax=Pleurodeles waltl TaxID=8319 RepID=A0AAV7UQW6_PLEWA|nr:hypothetical protein NDU88_000771 [Pleurodeles waltl]